MRCPNCLSVIQDDSEYCPYCGNIFSTNSPAVNNQTSETTSINIFISGIAVIIFMISFLLVVISGFSAFKPEKVGPNDLTLEKVIELSEKGYQLSLRDFDNFICERESYNSFSDTQERVYRSHSDYTFKILVSGQRTTKPEKILLMPKKGGYSNNVDIRNKEDVIKFIEKNRKKLED